MRAFLRSFAVDVIYEKTFDAKSNSDFSMALFIVLFTGISFVKAVL